MSNKGYPEWGTKFAQIEENVAANEIGHFDVVLAITEIVS